jgi:DNA adenine methylase
MTAAPSIKRWDPKPIIKSAGGKTRLLPELLRLVPDQVGRYYEPFIGGGALFFALQKQQGLDMRHRISWTIGDNNAELMNLYEVVKDNAGELIRALKDRYGDTGKLVYEYDKEQYLKIRAFDTTSLGKTTRAARFMYLNKTCFNGLWRVNKSGRFNVPMGRYKNPVICDEDAILAASRALEGVDLIVGDFEDVLNVCDPEEGDVVYFDPPYDPLESADRASFTRYTVDDFTWKNQIRLYVRARYLAKKGVTVIASNADTKRIRELWQGFEVTEVEAARSINSKTEKRGKITELVFHNRLET